MLATRPRALVALCATLLAIALTATPAMPAPLAAPPGAPRVYLLRGGNSAADALARTTLTEAGFADDLGVETPDFTGAEADLADYDLVVALYNSNVNRNLSVGGANALASYVRDGGGLLTGEWITWQTTSLDLTNLAGVLPATSCGINTAGATTFNQLAPNPVINAGLPLTFTIPLANYSGSEGCLEPQDEATVLYGSSNGGGRSGRAAGLVAWNPPGSAGRVASFSTLLSGAELASPQLRRLLQNTATWVAKAKDLTAPTIRRFTISGAGTLSSARDLTLAIQANDRGGSRLSHLYVVEYTYSGDLDAPWTAVQRSGWVIWGNGANRSLSWQLTDDPGVHFLQIFVSDRAGNVSSSPGLDFVSYLPPGVSVGTNAQQIYRLRPAAGSAVRVRLDVRTGNPDLYAFSLLRPGLRFAPESDLPVEQVDFTADGGVYQIEVEGHQAGGYQLTVSSPKSVGSASGPQPRVRPRTSIITLRSYDPDPVDANLPAAPASEGPATVGLIIYMPLLQR